MVNNRISLQGPRGALTVEKEEKKADICSQSQRRLYTVRYYHSTVLSPVRSPDPAQGWAKPGPGVTTAGSRPHLGPIQEELWIDLENTEARVMPFSNTGH